MSAQRDEGTEMESEADLEAILARLSPELVVARAREVDASREMPADWVRHHGFDDAGLWGTPFEWAVGLAARAEGAFAFDRLERTFLGVPDAWVHPACGPAQYRLRRGPERVEAPLLWPFCIDAPVADFSSETATRWWSHGLVHALVGAGLWEGMTEWEIMAQARLSEALAAVHWYCLSELGRIGDGDLPLDLTSLRGDEGARYAALARRALDPDSRARKLGQETSLGMAANALELLRYELFAYRSALHLGNLVEPEGTYLGLGEACEYAKVHRLRLNSYAHGRWRERCLIPGRDFAPDAIRFEARVARVAETLLLRPLSDLSTVGSEEVAARRLRRVLQDLGGRLCHAEALEGPRSTRHEGSLRLIGEALSGGAAAEPALLDALCERIVSEAGPVDAADILALGYHPLPTGREAAPLRRARRRARVRRAFALHPAIGSAVVALPEVLERTLDAPGGRLWLEGAVPIAEELAREGAIRWEGYGYIGWLTVATALWREHQAVEPHTRWHYRMARDELPEDPAEWAGYEVVWNPYAQRIPMPYEPRWDEAHRLSPETEIPSGADFKPRAAHAVWYCLIGQGRSRPIYVPLNRTLNALVQALKRPCRLDALLQRHDFDVPFMRKAIEDEVVLLMHRPVFDLPERPLDMFEIAMAAGASVEQRREDPGPWDREEQATAYAAFCGRWGLYRDTSAALCEAAELSEGQRVAEVGFGTGETTRQILARIGSSGRVVAADPALRLVTGIFDHINDRRARFLPGGARALLHIATADRPFDRVVANSSLTLAPDLTEALGLCARMLAPGGRLAFSLPAEYLGHTEHLTTPPMLEALGALEAARAELGIGHPAPSEKADRALGSVDALVEALNAAGLEVRDLELYARSNSAEEYFDWLGMPVVCEGMVGAEDTHRALDFVTCARQKVAPGLGLETRWYIIVAERRAEEET